MSACQVWNEGKNTTKNSTLNIDPNPQRGRKATTKIVIFIREKLQHVWNGLLMLKGKRHFIQHSVYAQMIIIILSSQLIYCHSSFFFLHLLCNWNFFLVYLGHVLVTSLEFLARVKLPTNFDWRGVPSHSSVEIFLPVKDGILRRSTEGEAVVWIHFQSANILISLCCSIFLRNL